MNPEAELVLSDTLTRLESLAVLQLAHELRSPLAAIVSSLDMLLQGYAGSDAELQTEMLSLARDRAASVLTLVNRSLRRGVFGCEALERQSQPVQMLEVLQALLPEKRVRARSKSIDLRLDAPEFVPLVNAGLEDVEFLLSNLIDNAIKYTCAGGRVTVSVGEGDLGAVCVVEDTGIGIASEDVPRVFEGFYRTPSAEEVDPYGSGLGLTIAKRVVQLYSGQLEGESEPGKGSRFSLTLPAVEGIGG